VVIYSISSQKWPVIVDGALDVVPVLPDEDAEVPEVLLTPGDEIPVVPAVVPSLDPVAVEPSVVTTGPVGPDEAPVGPVVDGALVVTPGPVGPVVDGAFVVTPDPVGPAEAPVVDGAFVVKPDPVGPDEAPVGPVVAAEEDVVVPSAHAVTDNVTSVGPLLSVVCVTFITISLTSSVGNSFVGNEVGCPCIGAVSTPDTVVNVTSISATFSENTRMLCTIAPPLGILIKNEMLSLGKSTPFVIKSVLLEMSTGCTITEFVAIRVEIYSISSQK